MEGYTKIAFKHLGYWEFYKPQLNNIDTLTELVKLNLNKDEYEISFHEIVVTDIGLERLERLFDIG